MDFNLSPEHLLFRNTVRRRPSGTHPLRGLGTGEARPCRSPLGGRRLRR